MNASSLIFLMGAVELTRRLYVFVLLILENLVLKSDKDLMEVYGKKGKTWALVTGCTSGIGLEYAKALAKRGFNMILVSRDLKKLKDLEEELMQFHPGIEFKII